MAQFRDYGTSRHAGGGDRPNGRSLVFFVCMVLLATVLVGRLVVLMVLQHGFYAALASDQQEIYERLFPERGDIVVRDKQSGALIPLATNRMLHLVYADPRKIKDPLDAATRLMPLFGISVPAEGTASPEVREEALKERQTLINKLSKKDDPYEVLKRGVTDDVVQKIQELQIDGIRFFDESSRYYPEPKLGGQLLGFLGFDDKGNRVGRYGLEGKYNKELSGKMGFLQSAKGARGGWIALSEREIQPAEDGATIVLSIDRMIQYFACERLRETVKKFEATGGSVVIMDPKTGAVLAMCGVPDYDPNEYRSVSSVGLFNNPAIYAAYEPGSVMKAMTIASAIDAGMITPTTTYEDKGRLEIGEGVNRRVINNSDKKANGVQTMTQVLEKSLNTGSVFAAEKLTLEQFRKYFYDFGFGKNTGIDTDKEVPGTLASLDKQGRIYRMTASFGQGITATPLQVAAAFGAIANGGVLMKPFVVEEKQYGNGRIEKTEPQEVRRVISDRAASLVSAMLVSVVERGHGTRAGVPGYYVAGKTGTAQIAGTDGRYEEGVTIGTFAGFAPVEDPKFVMVVRIDRPQGVTYAESTAAPLFGEIAKFLLQYFEIPKTR